VKERGKWNEEKDVAIYMNYNANYFTAHLWLFYILFLMLEIYRVEQASWLIIRI
jgi:hypothetical protein